MKRIYTKCKFCGAQNIHMEDEVSLSSNVVSAEVRAIVDEVLDTIPFYAYGDNEAAVRMIEALHKIRDKVSEHFS